MTVEASRREPRNETVCDHPEHVAWWQDVGRPGAFHSTVEEWEAAVQRAHKQETALEETKP